MVETAKNIPTLAEWVGGLESLRALTKRFYEKVPQGLLLETADEVGVPSDPEFRAAFVGYLEWGTRLAVLNSQDGVAPPPQDAPMPAWNWDPPSGPWQG